MTSYQPSGFVPTSSFGMRINPFNGTQTFHAGVDYAAPAGTVIPAAVWGTVWYSGPNVGLENVVIVRSDGSNGPYYTLYAHMQNGVFHQVGDQIVTGQTIGMVGDTGNVNGAYLHFEVITGATPASGNGGPIGIGICVGRSDQTCSISQPERDRVDGRRPLVFHRFCHRHDLVPKALPD